MRQIVFMALALICVPPLAGQACAAQKGVPTGAIPAGTIKGMTKLSESECTAAKGEILPKTICASGQACGVQDENSKWHYVCLTKK